MAHDEEYVRLIDEGESHDLDKPQSTHRRNTSYGLPPLLRWAAVALLIVGAIDVLALACIARMVATVFQDNDAVSRLTYANPYIGLDELYQSGRVNSSAIAPILLRPQFSAQVFPDNPERLSPRGERDRWLDGWGTVSPNEMHLRVTSTPATQVHTIVQFRTIDFGMEDCRLVFSLPDLGAHLEAGAAVEMDQTSRFDVFRLAADGPVDVKALSYRTRPARAARVATSIQARAGDNTVIHRFPCLRASLYAFEVACAKDSACFLDVWSSQNTSYGVNIYQHQTI